VGNGEVAQELTRARLWPRVSGRKNLKRKIAAFLLALTALVSLCTAYAQQGKVYRIGIVRQGGSDYSAVEGLKEVLKELGLAEGRDYVLDNRDLEGDPNAIRIAAAELERQKVDLIYSIATSVTLGVKRATMKTPIVFAVGSDPAAAGLVESFAKPGGRLTGVHYSDADLTAKRLEILNAMLPKLRRVATFYNPGNPVAVAALKSARDAARQVQIEIVESRVASVSELGTYLSSFKSQDADAFFYVNDTMVRSQAELIIETMRAKKVPTMFSLTGIVAQGALAGYGVSFREVGRSSARHVQKVLTGTYPGDMPVESVSRVELALNLRTARDIGIAIPQSVRLSASEIIE
jgi:putative ABC transport system substrate-binding protein